MNEETPSQIPPPVAPQVPAPPPGPGEPPSFWLMFGLGIGLLVVSCALCPFMQSPAPIGWAALGAFVTVFLRGYRGIFIGFLAAVGVLILGLIIMCGTGLIPPFRE
jgi:hypothetical protein